MCTCSVAVIRRAGDQRCGGGCADCGVLRGGVISVLWGRAQAPAQAALSAVLQDRHHLRTHC